MSGVLFPSGYQLEPLRRDHSRQGFDSGVREVDAWLATRALQSQSKRLSSTKLLVAAGRIAGYFTLASGHIKFDELPIELARGLPRRTLPVATLAWLGVDRRHQGQGLGARLLAQALRDCCAASKAFPFIAVVLDCLNEDAKQFYQRWDFRELPGAPYRLYLSAARLEAMMTGDQ
ncbi:MAG: GNAT family N-acetyltransferase [Pirellulales bacterium]|nr:GNAT family N-acetyltransferase [Pirellulales bacterium]